MTFRRIFLSLFLLSFFFLGVHAATAQSSTGTLEGTVLDPHQRPIYNAVVTVVQLDTNRTLVTRTTHAGVYSFPGLDSGAYSITVTAPTFNTETTSGIQIDAGAQASRDFTLKVGSQDVSVTVYGEAVGIEADNSAVGNTVSKDLLEEIPLADHSSLGLVTLIPGVQGDPVYANGVMSELPGIYTNPTIPGAALSIGGSRPGLVSQLIDGFDITQSGYPRAGVTFTPFAIKQISVQMASMQAEYGRTGGGIINQASQSGGNQYHGTFEYRHTDPGFGQAYRTGSNQRSDNHQTLYGGVFSGPVGLPHMKKLKDTFFLFTYEPLRQRQVVFSRTRVETPDELNGLFFNKNGSPSLDLLNTTALKNDPNYNDVLKASEDSSGNPLNNIFYDYPINTPGYPAGFPAGTPSASVLIPGDDISAQVNANPVASFMRAHYPTPSAPGKYVTFDNLLGTYAPDGTNAYAARGVVNHDDRYSIRLDHTFPNNDHIFARYTVVPVSGVRYGFLGPDNPMNNIATDTTTSRNWALNYVHLFGSRIVNESRVSYIRGYRYRIPPPSALTQDYGAALGLPAATNGVGFPTFNFNGVGPVAPSVGGGGSFQDGGRSLDEGYGYGNTTTIVFGRHQVKFGAEFRALQLNRTDDSNTYGGTYNFSNQDTGASGQNGTSTGSPIASFELGIINQFTTAGSQPFYYRWKYIAGFVEDSWKATSHLTINYGMRYNLEYPRSEKNNLQGSFLPNVTGYPIMTNGVASTTLATGGLVRSGSFGLGKYIFPVNYAGFEPRLGIAYSPRSWVVMKAGYALIHAPLTGNGNSIEPNFAPAAQQINRQSGGVKNICTGTPCPNSAFVLDYITNTPAPINRIGAVLNQNPQFSYTTGLLPQVDQTNKVPYIEIWNAGFQFLAGHSTVLEANYVGQRGIHLYSPYLGVNLPDQNVLYADQQKHVNFNAGVTNAYGVPGSETFLQSLQPYQQFYNNAIYQAYNRHSFSIYHGLYLSARRQATKNLTILGGFTWQKSLDSNSTPTADGVAIDNFGLTLPQDPYTLKGDYSVSSFDQPVRVTAGYSYRFPFGKGQPFFGANHRILSQIFGGFSTSGYYSAQSGLPSSVGEGNNGFFLSQNPIGVGATNTQVLGALGATQLYNHLRPNLIPGVPLINPHWKSNKLGLKADPVYGNGFLNENAFQAPGSRDNPQYGNAPRELSAARGPRIQNWDASVRKAIQLSHGVGMQLWTDIQNAANHPNFFTTSGNVFSGALLNSTNPSAPYPITGPFQFNTNFSVPSAFSATRTINVGASISF